MAGALRPTIADVARLSGVSRATASKALNGKDRVDPATRDRVRRTAEEIGYTPNVRAQRLRGGRSHTIALLTALPDRIVGEASEMGFLLDMAMPVARACLAHGYSLLLVPPGTEGATLDALDVDGAVVVDPVTADPYCAALRRRGVAVVTIGRAQETEVDAVVDRGLAGADVMIEHLLERGARHIATIVTQEGYSLSATLEGHLDRLRRRHPAIRFSALRASASGGEESGYGVALQALRDDPSIDAVYAPLDAFAVGVLRAATELDRVIPADLMVATNYDGRRAETSDPPLTALNLGLPEMARQAVDLLIGQLSGDGDSRAEAATPVVIARTSTAR